MSVGPRAALLIADARRNAGLTQASLARRMGVPQSVVARLERPGSNPTWDTMCRALDACGFELDVRRSQPERSSIDPTLVHSMMRVPVDERLGRFDRAYVEVQKIAGSVRREHGELG
ncbi:MAG TPA: helix-turn-helix transcriptional regulator [Solirubrobacteraceae bacterium]|nr:helix-turn-helix transcriptional regulator [Solirubrobacteraceae bacterium]